MVVFQNKSIHKYWFGSLKHRKTKYYSIFTQLYENSVFLLQKFANRRSLKALMELIYNELVIKVSSY